MDTPDAVDLRRPWHSVTDEGNTGSVGWAVADSVLRWQLVASGVIPDEQRLSPRFVQTAAKELEWVGYPSTFILDDGPSLKSALDVVRRFGAALEEDLPVAGGMFMGSAEQLFASAARHRIRAYFNLGDDSVEADSVVRTWRQWLSQRSPILVRLRVDRSINSPTATLETFDEASVVGAHAAALFGFAPDHFLLRASWGAHWGDEGYAQLGLEYATAAISESWGLVG